MTTLDMLRERDSEIERLKTVIESQNHSIDRHLTLITELQQIQDNHQNEMTRLDLQIDSLEDSDELQKALITELADALRDLSINHGGEYHVALVKRAREATRDDRRGSTT